MRLHKTPTSLVESSNVLVPVKGLQMEDQLSQVHTHLAKILFLMIWC